MSQKKLLLLHTDSENGSFRENPEKKKKSRLKTIICQSTIRTSTSEKKPELRIVRVEKENSVSYEEFLDILQKPHVFTINFSNKGCCRKRQMYTHFEISNLPGRVLLKGKYADDAIRIFDDRNRLFMMIDYMNSGKEAIVSVPNSSIPLSTIKKVPAYAPFTNRYKMSSEHFPELNLKLDQHNLLRRQGKSLGIYEVLGSDRKVIAKLMLPASSDEMHVLVDDSVSVFQKTGVLASAIFIGQRSKKKIGNIVCVALIFVIVFLVGFVLVASTLLNLRYKNPDFEGLKFPAKLKSDEMVPLKH